MTSSLEAIPTTNRLRSVPEAVKRSYEAPPAPKPEPDDGMPEGRPPHAAPASIRFTLWLVYLVRHTTLRSLIRAVSRLIRRLIVWFLLLYLKLYGFMVAITGGRVTETEYEQRNGECAMCDGRIVRPPGFWSRWVARLMGETAASRQYCGPCDCPLWFLARLVGWLGKNRWRRHYCPRETHSATDYPTFITISPSGCGQEAFKIPGGRANGHND